MLPIVTPEEMRAIDAAAPEPVDVLIERAGRRLARSARQMLGGVYGRRVVAIAGPGNNGADARVAARVLRTTGVHALVVEPGDALPPCHLVIDGAFGTGMNRPWSPPAVPTGAQVLAVDVPSGIDGLTGAIHGGTVTAQRTVTFAALKPGLLLSPGSGFVGDVEVADIGLDVGSARSFLFTRQDAWRHLPHRGPDDHKWRRAVAVVGGSTGMTGAPLLAAEAAARSGAGYVRCVLPGGLAPTGRHEAVFQTPPATDFAAPVLADLDRFHALVVGPGMAADAGDEVRRLIDDRPRRLPVVIDGTALRLLEPRPRLGPSAVLTPHDGEYEALMGERPGPDRFEAARRCARRYDATVLLKGPLTIVATPDGRAIASARGDARLATAGSGDVLAGTIGALLASGLEPVVAAAFGAWLHGDAGHRGPELGFVASDLLPGLAHSLTELAAGVPGGIHATH